MEKLPYKVDSLESVPESIREFYSENDGAYVLNYDDSGIKSLTHKEREARRIAERKAKELEIKLAEYGDYTPDSFLDLKDKIEEMKLNSGKQEIDFDNIPDELKDKITGKAVEVRTAKLNREYEKLKAEYEKAIGEKSEIEGKFTSTMLENTISELARKNKSLITESAVSDAILLAKSSLKYDRDANDFIGNSGESTEEWLVQAAESREHWQPRSTSAHATGGTGKTSSQGREESFKAAQQTGDINGMLANAKTID